MPNQPEGKRKPIYGALVLLGLYSLMPFLLLSFYAYPQADDYSFAVRDSQQGFWSTQVEYFLNWSGRFFGTAVLRLNPLINYSFSTYPYYALGIILALAGSLTLLLFQLFRPYLSAIKIFSLAALLLALYLVQLPSPAESLFWLTGFLTYTLPSVFLLLQLFLLLLLVRAQSQSMKAFWEMLAMVVGACIAGSNEMALVCMMSTLLLILSVSWLHRTNSRYYLLVVFAFCLLVSLVVVLAPGNFARMVAHPQARQPLWSVVYAGTLTLTTLYRWGPLLLLASLVYVFSFGGQIKEALGHQKLFQVPLPLLIIYILGTVFLMNFLFAWATGERPTPRLENVIYFFLLLSWFYTLQVFIHQKSHWFGSDTWPAFVKGALGILLLLSFLNLENNISTAYLDLLSGKASQYHSELSARNRQIASSNCQKCVVQPVNAVPASLHFLDVQVQQNEADKWVNDSYAEYWGKKTVILSEPTPPVADNYETLVKVGKRWREKLFH